MKKLLFSLLALSIFFSACEKEEEEVEESNSNSNINITVSNITGIWEATSFIVDGANLSSLATILYWIRPDMFIEENIQYNNTSNINDNIGTWELSGSNLIIEWVTGEKITYQITSLSNDTAFGFSDEGKPNLGLSILLVEWLNDDGDIVSTSGSANLVKQ